MTRVGRPYVTLLALLAPGCRENPSAGGLAGMRIDPAAAVPIAASADQTFDLGPILAYGQIIRHDFTLTNLLQRPIRIIGATCSAPCCAKIETMPKTVPPHGEGRITVAFRPSRQTGLKVVQFLVETDSTEQPVRPFTLRARLFSECEFDCLGAPVGIIPIGKTGKEIWRVVCRRKGSQGLHHPRSVEVTAPLQARFTGTAHEEMRSDGLIEESLDVEVTMPATQRPGSQWAELRLSWLDGHRETRVVRWEVTPVVRVIPSSIVIEQTSGLIERSVTVSSEDQPFRILGVRGAMIFGPVGSTPAVEMTHRLTLRLDAGRACVGRISSIVIETNHPSQPELTLRVPTLPPEPDKRGVSWQSGSPGLMVSR